MKKTKTYARIVVNLLVTLIMVLLIIFVAPKVVKFFIPFVVAYFISAIANPLVRFMEKRIRIVRKHSSAIIIIVTIGAVIGILYLVISILIKETISLINDIPSIARQLNDTLEQFSVSISKFGAHFPTEIKDLAEILNKYVEEFLSSFFNGIKMPSVFETASGYVKTIANGFFMLIVTIIASYFFIADRDKIIELSKAFFPEAIVKGYQLVVDNFKNAVGGYFKAQFKIMCVLTLIMWITFQVIKIRYSFLIALGIAFIDLLPIFGTGAVLGPWTVILFTMGNYVHAIVLVVLYLVCQLIKQLLQPKMVGDSIGISPMSALVFMFIGYRLFGVFGMIIGIPTGMIIINFYRIGLFDQLIKGFKIIILDINEFRKF